MTAPLCIDLFCGLGGWAEGFLAEGYRVVGFDVERHRYPPRTSSSSSIKQGGSGAVWFDKLVDERRRAVPFTGQYDEYPSQLVLQDVLTLHGSQFRDAAVIVASPPCQEYSYMAMPWSRAKQIAREYRDGTRDVADLTRLFDACFRIQREASEAAGRHIPMVVENVRGAQPWVGRAKWHYGSFYLWGDVPALMPSAYQLKQATTDGLKLRDLDGYQRNHPEGFGWNSPHTSSRSSSRKAASAQIAKIPFDLARHIARVYRPQQEQVA